MADGSAEFHSEGPIDDSLKSAMAESQASAQDTNDFKTRIPEELRGEKVWEKFKTEGDVYKSYVELEKYRGANPRIPGPDAKPEEIAAFHKRMGVPEKPDGYKLNLPKDASPEFVNEFLSKVAHPNGMTPSAAQAAADWWTNDIYPKLQAATVTPPTPEEAEAAQKEHWGPDYQKNMDSFDRFVRRYVKDESTAAAFDALPGEARIKLFDAIAEAGSGLREGNAIDTVNGGTNTGPGKSQLEARKAEIFSDPRYTNDNKLLRQPLIEEMNQINQKLRSMNG